MPKVEIIKIPCQGRVIALQFMDHSSDDPGYRCVDCGREEYDSPYGRGLGSPHERRFPDWALHSVANHPSWDLWFLSVLEVAEVCGEDLGIRIVPDASCGEQGVWRRGEFAYIGQCARPEGHRGRCLPLLTADDRESLRRQVISQEGPVVLPQKHVHEFVQYSPGWPHICGCGATKE